MPVEISYLKDDGVFPYDLILDRISHEIPFYRTYLKCAAASGVQDRQQPDLVVGRRQVLRQPRRQGGQRGRAAHRAPAAQGLPAEHRGQVVPQHAAG